MKNIIKLVSGSLFFSSLSFSLFALPANNSSVPLDKIVAVINSDVITQSELNQQIESAKLQMQNANMPLPDGARLRSQVLDQLIYQKLQLLLAKREGITVSDPELTKAISSIAQKNHLSLDQLKAVVAKQGTSFADFRNQIRDQIIMQQLEIRALGPSLMVTDEEVKEHLRKFPSQAASQFHVENILIPLPSSPTTQEINVAQKKAQDMLQQLHQGTNFEKLASKNEQFGDLGWRKGSELPTIFAEQVIKMKVGGVTGPIQAPNGFHLIKLVDEKTSNLADIKNQVRQSIYQQKLAQRLQPWLQQLRASAYVKIVQEN